MSDFITTQSLFLKDDLHPEIIGGRMTQLISERAENRYRNKNFLYVNCRWLIPS